MLSLRTFSMSMRATLEYADIGDMRKWCYIRYYISQRIAVDDDKIIRPWRISSSVSQLPRGSRITKNGLARTDFFLAWKKTELYLVYPHPTSSLISHSKQQIDLFSKKLKGCSDQACVVRCALCVLICIDDCPAIRTHTWKLFQRGGWMILPWISITNILIRIIKWKPDHSNLCDKSKMKTSMSNVCIAGEASRQCVSVFCIVYVMCNRLDAIFALYGNTFYINVYLTILCELLRIY